MLALAQQVGNRNDNTGISFDEMTIEIGESKKYLNIKDRFENRPFSNGVNAFGIYGDSFR